MWFHLRLLEQCNLRCRHCYAKHNDRSSRLRFRDIKRIRKVIQSLPVYDHDNSVVYLSGGEPLLHPGFDKILDYVCFHFEAVHILSNGILLPDKLEAIRKRRHKACVQISLEGGRRVNDAIRGRGTFDKIVSALELLKRHEIRHWISYTVSKDNADSYRDVLDVALQTESFFNNFSPYTGDTGLMLDLDEWENFKQKCRRYGDEIGLLFSYTPEICGEKYRCAIGTHGFTIFPDKTVTGCPRNPEKRFPYKDMKDYLLKTSRRMHQTCMKAKWRNNDPCQ